MKIYLFILSTLLSSLAVPSYAQKEGHIWYFGDKAGIDFNTIPPTALVDGEMTTSEGCATIADANGKLLFYTDGTTIWNKNHQPMPNAQQDLMGNSSSTQSAIVLRKPGSIHIYIVLTVDILATNRGLRYSEVDMRLNGGLGDINRTKNVLVQQGTCEKITLIEHQNEEDFWLINQQYGEGKHKFQCYKITSSGIALLPILTDIGAVIETPLHTIGYLKASSDGTKLVSANTNHGSVELFDFDNERGKVSNLVTLDGFTDNKPYGVEFSPDNRFLYVSESSKNAKLYQYDISLGNEASIRASRVLIGSIAGYYGALQLGPDNQIYIANDNQEHLSVIKNPTSKGLASDYQEIGISLNGKRSRRGLPTFTNSIVIPLSDLKIENKCLGDVTRFRLKSTVDLDSIRWSFGDPLSASNSSLLEEPTHLYSDTGLFHITAILSYPSLKDTLIDSVYIAMTPTLFLGEDTTVCEGESFRLLVGFKGAKYRWQDGSTRSDYLVNTEGRYKVTANLNGCETTDSIDVDYIDAPEIELGNDLSGCEGNIVITPMITNGQFVQWQDGTTDLAFEPTISGIYWAEASNSDCTSRDSIFVNVKRFPKLEVTYYNSFCEGDSVSLIVYPIGYPIEWSTGSTDSILTVKEPGKYTVSQKCRDTLADGPSVTTRGYSMIVEEISPPDFDLAKDSILCIEKTLTLNAACTDGTYLWNDGSTDSTLILNLPGQYWVNATNECGTLTDTAYVKLKDCTCYLEMANAFSPNSDNLNETFAPTYVSCEFREYYFDIFNRWGELVFSTTNQNHQWDGTYRGELAKFGIYMYVLNYIDQDGVGASKKGIVTVIR